MVLLENIYNKEQFTYSITPKSKIVDGVEYISVVKVSNQREVLIRKDSVKVIEQKKVK